MISWAVQSCVLGSVAPLDSSSTTVTHTSPSMNSDPSQTPAPYGADPSRGGDAAASEAAAEAETSGSSPLAARYGATIAAGSGRLGSPSIAAASGETNASVSPDSRRRSSSRSRCSILLLPVNDRFMGTSAGAVSGDHEALVE